MRWSWKIGKLAGINVYMHATFLLLIIFILLADYLEGHSLAAALWGLAFVLVVFVCIVLHELGHALTARKYGIQTRDIILLPIGGVARLERMPEDPRQELRVALAGPAVNVIIAGALSILLAAAGMPPTLKQMTNLRWTGGHFLTEVAVINLWLAAFNLLPAFPMDGGRVLRALLATRMEYTQATQVAAQIGQGMAFLFGLAGLFYDPFLLFIALFVWILYRAYAIGRQAARLERPFAALAAWGIGVWIGVQTFINMGVNMGVLPTKGLTLPFLSFGGSGIVANCVTLAILLRIDYENRRLLRGFAA